MDQTRNSYVPHPTSQGSESLSKDCQNNPSPSYHTSSLPLAADKRNEYDHSQPETTIYDSSEKAEDLIVCQLCQEPVIMTPTIHIEHYNQLENKLNEAVASKDQHAHQSNEMSQQLREARILVSPSSPLQIGDLLSIILPDSKTRGRPKAVQATETTLTASSSK
jgi:hypothetical protein